jgi:sec-independent protein translocase protein TatC
MADFSPEPPEDEGGPVKTFLEHLEDFRWLLVKCAVAVAVAMLICLIGANYVIGIIKWPLMQARVSWPGTNQIISVSFGTNRLGNFPISPEQQLALQSGSNRFAAITVEPLTVGTNQVLGWRLNDDPKAIAEIERMHVDLVNLTPAGGFFVAFQVALYGGMVLAAPFLLYFIAQFVFPALRLKERKYIYQALIIGGGLFMVGVSFCYFILMPVALSASQMYSQWLGLGAFQWRAEEYISFVCRFMLGMGLGFELPVVLLTLVKIGVLNYRILRAMWRYMIVINLILGALLTTPEVVTQVLMAAPLYGLYEITVWIAWGMEQSDRTKVRRTVWFGLGVLLLMAGLIWAGWKYAGPLVNPHLQK